MKGNDALIDIRMQDDFFAYFRSRLMVVAASFIREMPSLSRWRDTAAVLTAVVFGDVFDALWVAEMGSGRT